MEVDKYCANFFKTKRYRRQHFSGGEIDGGDSGAAENRGSGVRKRSFRKTLSVLYSECERCTVPVRNGFPTALFSGGGKR
jgi:hypothetical protein